MRAKTIPYRACIATHLRPVSARAFVGVAVCFTRSAHGTLRLPERLL